MSAASYAAAAVDEGINALYEYKSAAADLEGFDLPIADELERFRSLY